MALHLLLFILCVFIVHLKSLDRLIKFDVSCEGCQVVSLQQLFVGWPTQDQSAVSDDNRFSPNICVVVVVPQTQFLICSPVSATTAKCFVISTEFLLSFKRCFLRNC